MHLSPSLTIAGVLLAGVFCQWFAWRIKAPAIIPLLAAGFVAGPLLNLIDPRASLGELFFPLVSLSVAIILFEGALTLTWSDVRYVVGPVRGLLTVGALVTWFGGAAGAHFIVGLPWNLALLFGALIIVTGPTVIAPLLRNVRPTANIASILRWEGIIIDPIGASIAVLVFDLVVAGAAATWTDTLITFAKIVLIGGGLGLAAGYFTYLALRRFWIPDYLRDIAILALVVGVFAVSNTLAHESGLTAVTVMGIFLANANPHKLHELLYFKEKLSVLLISTLFILLAATITVADMQLLDWRAFALVGVVMFVLRPVGVLLSTIGSQLSRNERLFLAWIAPRGIVAASVTSVFVLTLVELGYAEARIIVPLVFLVIVATVLVQGGTAKWVARRLGVAEADPQGFLMVGANTFSCELAAVLQRAGVVVRLIDVNYNNVAAARLRGLNAMQGNVLSTFVEDDIDLTGVGRLLALTNNEEANALACKHFEDEFGSASVFQLPPVLNTRTGEQFNQTQLGRLLFARTATFATLQAALESGGQIKITPLTEQFAWNDFRQKHGDKVLPLMAIRKRAVVVATVNFPLTPQAGWSVVSLFFPAAEADSWA
jgi:NhaP-type Na+/H+ or K+/H+ antiporter